MDSSTHKVSWPCLSIQTTQINLNEDRLRCNFNHSNREDLSKSHLLTKEHLIFYKGLWIFFLFFLFELFLLHRLFLSLNQHFLFRILFWYLHQNGGAFLEFLSRAHQWDFAKGNYCSFFDCLKAVFQHSNWSNSKIH